MKIEKFSQEIGLSYRSLSLTMSTAASIAAKSSLQNIYLWAQEIMMVSYKWPEKKVEKKKGWWRTWSPQLDFTMCSWRISLANSGYNKRWWWYKRVFLKPVKNNASHQNDIKLSSRIKSRCSATTRGNIAITANYQYIYTCVHILYWQYSTNREADIEGQVS